MKVDHDPPGIVAPAAELLTAVRGKSRISADIAARSPLAHRVKGSAGMTTARLALVATILLALTSSAVAQPGMTPVQPAPIASAPGQPVPGSTPPPRDGGEPKSEGTALALSLGGTLASWGLIFGASALGDSGSDDAVTAVGTMGVLGAMFAPSFGHWYGGAFVTRGMGLRALGAVSAMAGVLVALSECPLFSEDPCNAPVGTLLLVAGPALFVGGTIDDIMTAPGRVKRYNERLAIELAVAPIVTHQSAGLALGGRF